MECPPTTWFIFDAWEFETESCCGALCRGDGPSQAERENHGPLESVYRRDSSSQGGHRHGVHHPCRGGTAQVQHRLRNTAEHDDLGVDRRDQSPGGEQGHHRGRDLTASGLRHHHREFSGSSGKVRQHCESEMGGLHQREQAARGAAAVSAWSCQCPDCQAAIQKVYIN